MLEDWREFRFVHGFNQGRAAFMVAFFAIPNFESHHCENVCVVVVAAVGICLMIPF